MENADHDKVSFESEAKINFYLLAVQFIKKKQKNSGVYVINRRQVGPLPIISDAVEEVHTIVMEDFLFATACISLSICLCSVLGNSLVVIVILKNKKLQCPNTFLLLTVSCIRRFNVFHNCRS